MFPLRLPASALALALLLSACAPQTPPQEPVRAVKLMTVQGATQEATWSFSGEVRARHEATLGFRVPGKLLSRAVELGQRVSAGQLLAQLDAQDYQAAALAAQAQVQAALTQRDVAHADWQRYQGLFAQGFISQAELDRRQAAAQAAQAQWEQARAQYTLQGNQAAYTRLLADAPGVVTAVDAQPGQVLAPGQAVVRVALEGPRDVVFALPQDKWAAMRTGTAVQVRAGEQVQPAVVRDVAGSADPITRTFTVKASLGANAASVALGEMVTVLWTPPAKNHGAKANAPAPLRVPLTALHVLSGQTSVWRLDAATMTVQPQPVEVEPALGEQVAVLKGLQAGDEVVVAGVHALTPGQKVTRYVAR